MSYSDERNVPTSNKSRRWTIVFIISALVGCQFQTSKYKIIAATSIVDQISFADLERVQRENESIGETKRDIESSKRNSSISYFGSVRSKGSNHSIVTGRIIQQHHPPQNRSSDRSQALRRAPHSPTSATNINVSLSSTANEAARSLPRFESNNNDVVDRSEGDKILDDLVRLTTDRNTTRLECHPPLKYYENRIVRSENTAVSDNRIIPRILHVSFKSRCLPQDIYMYLKRWEEQLPLTSIIFHDDNAVQNLIDSHTFWWLDFPWLQSAMKCVLSKGAMKVDVWRILVLYLYGGIYTDIDNWPEDRFDENTIPHNVSGFFYSDDWKRPSQWFMAFEAKHPIMYLTVEEIIRNLLQLKDVQHPRVVFVTGPHAVRQAYIKFLRHENVTLDAYRKEKLSQWGGAITDLGGDLTVDLWQSPQDLLGMSGKIVRKEPYPKGIIKPKKYYSDKVDYKGKVVKRKDRIAKESGVVYWKKDKYGNASDKRLCQSEQKKWRRYLDEGKNQTITTRNELQIETKD